MRTYKMSVTELEELIQVSRPRGRESMEKGIARATEVWRRIGARLGFDYKTARQDPTKENPRFFIAEPLQGTPSENDS